MSDHGLARVDIMLGAICNFVSYGLYTPEDQKQALIAAYVNGYIRETHKDKAMTWLNAASLVITIQVVCGCVAIALALFQLILVGKTYAFLRSITYVDACRRGVWKVLR